MNINLKCGCVWSFKTKRWNFCNEAKELQKKADKDFKFRRAFYDVHFTNKQL